MSLTNAAHEEDNHSKILPYISKFYLNFEYAYGLLNQYTALRNGDPDVTNNTSESINRGLKTISSPGKKTIQSTTKMNHNLTMTIILLKYVLFHCSQHFII